MGKSGVHNMIGKSVTLLLWVDVCGYVFNILSRSYVVKGRT